MTESAHSEYVPHMPLDPSLDEGAMEVMHQPSEEQLEDQDKARRELMDMHAETAEPTDPVELRKRKVDAIRRSISAPSGHVPKNSATNAALTYDRNRRRKS